MATIHNQELDKWPDKFKANEVHLVCVAAGGLSTCDCAASIVGGMDQDNEVRPLTEMVNRSGETGTFHPRLPLTIVPLPKWESRPYPDDVDGFLRRNFVDVAKVNREYIKLAILCIDLNGWGRDYPFDRARDIAEGILAGEPGIEAIYFAPKAT